MAHVFSTAVAILYGASRKLFSDNCQNKVQKPTISQIESTYLLTCWAETETYCFETKTSPKTHRFETKMRPRCWGFCLRQDRDETLVRLETVGRVDRDHIPDLYI